MIVERRTEVATSADELYAWHTRPGAFERLLPPWERVRLMAPHPGVTEGSRATLAVRVGPFTKTWVARHETVTPGRSFVDVLESGPFARWRHAHLFEPVSPDRAVLVDRIECELPGGPLGELAEPVARKRIRRALRYRHSVTAEDLALHARAAALPRLTVAITGASGLIGRTLSAMLTTGGHRVVKIVRREPAAGEIRWDPEASRLDPAGLTGVDAVVHLAGENIAGSRWSAAQKEKIRASRVKGTATIAAAILAASPRPRVLVSASAIGFYRAGTDAALDETAVPGTGFLPEVVKAWEAAAKAVSAGGVRAVTPRFAPVLSPAGGTLAKMLPIFSVGLGGPLGNGTQWMSWVSIDDCAGALVHLIQTEIEGAVNVVAPEVLTNAEFSRILGTTLHRPAVLPVPPVVLRAVLGSLAEEVLASRRVVPRRLLDSGYRFRYPTLAGALAHVLGRGSGG